MIVQSLLKRFGSAALSLVAVGVVMVSLSQAAHAQEGWNQRTRVTFSGPVEIPGRGTQVLPAGTYVFRLMDSLTNRHIVQIFNEDETRLYSTILAIPNYRRKPTDQTVITFAERPAGQPPAIQVWFYPGQNYGHEFVYPKGRATQLAEAAKETVLFVPEETIAAAAEAPPTPAPTAPPVVALEQAPVAAVAPTGEEIPVAEVVEAPPVLAASLPRTGSELPLIALAGVLAVSCGLLLGRVRRRLWVR